MQFQIDPTHRLPMYEQLKQQIREAIARGKLEPAEKLPSVRELSRQLVINPNTVARVYRELEDEGVLNNQQGSGTYVADRREETGRRARRQPMARLIDELLTQAIHLGMPYDEVVRLLAERAGEFQWPEPAGTR